MKTATLTLFLALFITTGALSQDILYGPKLGLNLATLQPDLPDPRTRTSIHFGGMAEIPITAVDKLYVQPELLYSGQGVRDESDDDEVVRLNYLTIPILAKYYVYEGVSVHAGPQLGFLLAAKVEDNDETIDIKDNTKGFDFGFALGAGYKTDLGIEVMLRYIWGSDVNDIDTDPEKFKNRVFQISIGYYINDVVDKYIKK